MRGPLAQKSKQQQKLSFTLSIIELEAHRIK
jgi:hypothetical protein